MKSIVSPNFLIQGVHGRKKKEFKTVLCLIRFTFACNARNASNDNSIFCQNIISLLIVLMFLISKDVCRKDIPPQNLVS